MVADEIETLVRDVPTSDRACLVRMAKSVLGTGARTALATTPD
jgi:hypothetical protein